MPELTGDSSAGWIDRRTIAKTAVGFAIAVVLVYLLGVGIGWDRTIDQLQTSQLEWVLAACGSTVLCLIVWGKTWHVVLERIGISVPYRKLSVTFFAATFANYVTPMGQAGGEPFIAYILARDTEATYEQALASVATTDLVRLLPFFTIGGLGLGYLLTTTQITGSIELFAIVLMALAVVLPFIAVVGWQFRDRLQRTVLRCIAPIAKRTDRITLDSIRDRIDRLYSSIEVIASSPRALLTAVAFAYIGWILFALPLYFASLALGTPISLLLVCFIVPISVIAGSVPLPGGLGAIEGALIVLLTTLTPSTTAIALAIATIYRLASYWLVISVGGIAMLWVVKRV
ncbi:lysylphosphatidylglycerol synthase transmembrane domain-containing protein [Halalkalicoccus tibetensis]|uniref:Lysylphosphatidylglycerol synthase transmembrane domain-containing protein n=1 Tax=Halalkalicoccus tibetensis TaxID=175632 RepID=A0ABD5VE02_9EURY